MDRTQVMWFGKSPSAADQLEAHNRGLVICHVSSGRAVEFTHARGAVFWATSPYFDSALSELELVLQDAVNNGVFVCAVVDETPGCLNGANRVLAKELPDGASHGYYQVRTSPRGQAIQSYEIPQRILTHIPGPIANAQLEISMPSHLTLSADERLLLSRAFYDCKAVALELITGGLSGAQTFYVRATLAASNAGPHPVPYFAKLHDASKLREEMSSFKVFAEHHVAWYLRPNFLPERCLYGFSKGVLVGSFVEDSKSLWEVAVDGQAPKHIRSLFTETLRVLRNSRENVDPGRFHSVVEPLEEFCRHLLIPAERVERAKRFGGEIWQPESLWRKLLNLPAKAWVKSSMHGDMHANNVRIRKDDAIVIDFAHATTGPMCADLASLEVWLSFEELTPISFDPDTWRRRVELLYRPSSFTKFHSLAETNGDSHWIGPCVSEIRKLAEECTISNDEYLRVISVYLLRSASFDAVGPDVTGENERRDYAYWLANRLISYLCQCQGTELEAA